MGIITSGIFTSPSMVSALKQLYESYWNQVPGAKEELLGRIKLLSSAEKAILGIEE